MLEKLTEKERQIVDSVGRGRTNHEVADELELSHKTVEWTLMNKDVFQHPFHIHVNPFQVVAVNARRVDQPVWWDTFALPPRDTTTGQPSTVQIRMRFRSDVTGKTVFHCHILPHEDNGMMSIFELVAGTR